MSYRDDVDALYTRSMMLQKEVDSLREQLAHRDEPTSPGMKAIRNLPAPDDVLSRLIDQFIERPDTDTPGAPLSSLLPGRYHGHLPPPPDAAVALDRDLRHPPTPKGYRRGAVLERARDLLGNLNDERLVLICAVIEGIADDDVTPAILNQLEALVTAVVRTA